MGGDAQALPQAMNQTPLKNAPHTAASLLAADGPQAYSREQAAFPVPALKAGKFFSPVGRVDNEHGDRNLFCSCVPVADSPEFFKG